MILLKCISVEVKLETRTTNMLGKFKRSCESLNTRCAKLGKIKYENVCGGKCMFFFFGKCTNKQLPMLEFVREPPHRIKAALLQHGPKNTK
jgi:hypothetical protein